MKILGLLSDSHGREAITERAAKLLVEQGAEALIHLGDVGSENVLEALLVGLDESFRPRPPVHVVFGNTDWNAADLGRFATQIGITVHDTAGRLVVGGKTIVFTHGHEPQAMQQALSGGESVDYLLHGHTHKKRDQKFGATRVINPGALYRAATHTAALLDVEQDRVTFFNVGDE